MSDLLIEHDGDLLVLTLNRPEKLNALSPAMRTAAFDAVTDVIERRSARAILLTGAGRGFCAGADLDGDNLTDRRARIEGQVMAGINRLVQALREVPVPVVVALNGPVAGGGVGLALAGDIVIAARSATFTLAFARIGAVLDAGASWILPRLVGPARATAMAFLADEPVDAETAVAWGLVWKVVDDDALMDEARALARRLAAGPTVALGLIKRELALSQSVSLEESLRFEAACQRQAFNTDDFMAGVRAFQRKTPPDFKGK
ncbi:MAG: enoyl-CoA hydratase/isomerase family protein [Hyphomicrobiales bacterium]|nr:enoyl-CoA hydratase/isomerase family protein [Hyphomicrobiales bacterium]MCP5371274.1 enoyl-CoA hydratase/isomerase family protein [Hyphomicrobiales bacterium]